MPPRLRFFSRPRKGTTGRTTRGRTSKGCPTSRAFRDVGAKNSTTTVHQTTVILSAVASSRSEEATQSKDPYVPANLNNAKRNSDKNTHWNQSTTAVILRQRSPWQNQGPPTKDLCTLRPSAAWRGRPRPRTQGRAWLQPCHNTSIRFRPRRDVQPQPRSGERMQPTARSRGKMWNTTKPQRGER